MVSALLLKTWMINIGNEIIENGAKAAIKRAVPDLKLFETSGYSYHLVYSKFRYSLTSSLLNKLGFKRDINKEWHKNLVSSAYLIHNKSIDFAVFPGCILDKFTLPRYYPILLKLMSKGIPIILLGAGGHDYTKATVDYVSKILKKLKPLALITRDSVAYEYYSQISEIKYVYNGIDCGFFINDWYQPPQADKKFIVLAFDKASKVPPHVLDRIKSIDSDVTVIFTTHRPFNYLYYTIPADVFARLPIAISRFLLARRELLKSDRNLLNKENVFISDNVKDYLFLYSNAVEVHSDRVHAVVSSLAYDTRAWLYYSTPRALLFENVGAKINENLIVMNKKVLTTKKKELVTFLREIIEDNFK
ncbi:polysaccharide pyruvyl transferase family protein [Thermococcus barophilus]|uniref:Polysaccharide pyruvyl transferase domain-containing protein n=1 Tax=Thermococcus barophilus (strain DSM 11836 / MP) TaxID=391623 RepID=F0LL03_THEBM|nr:polysaccharide pyruvyl transferase family protein [Thermococcus barophilus]ADT84910.1 hypothetical protein TERMP_01935 [Thermococcus barophilus MP]